MESDVKLWGKSRSVGRASAKILGLEKVSKRELTIVWEVGEGERPGNKQAWKA